MSHLSRTSQKVAEKLAKTAKGAYTKNTPNNISKKKDCDDLDVEAPNVCTMQEPTIEGGIQQLHRKIKHLEPLAPPVPTLPSMEINSSFIFLNEANKLPHCKSCQHARKGHTCSKQNKNVIQCPLCPDSICSVLGRKVLCTCEWHSSNRENSLSQVYRGFTNSIQDSVVWELLDCLQELLKQIWQAPHQLVHGYRQINVLVGLQRKFGMREYNERQCPTGSPLLQYHEN